MLASACTNLKLDVTYLLTVKKSTKFYIKVHYLETMIHMGYISMLGSKMKKKKVLLERFN